MIVFARRRTVTVTTVTVTVTKLMTLDTYVLSSDPRGTREDDRPVQDKLGRSD